MLDKLTPRKAVVRFFMDNGQCLYKVFSEDEARSVVENWASQHTPIIGCTTQKEITTLWGIRSDKVIFLDVIYWEDFQEQQRQVVQQQQQQQQQQSPGMPPQQGYYHGGASRGPY